MTRKDPLAAIRDLAPHVTDEQELSDRLKLHKLHKEALKRMQHEDGLYMPGIVHGIVGLCSTHAYGTQSHAAIQRAYWAMGHFLQGLDILTTTAEDDDGYFEQRGVVSKKSAN